MASVISEADASKEDADAADSAPFQVDSRAIVGDPTHAGGDPLDDNGNRHDVMDPSVVANDVSVHITN